MRPVGASAPAEIPRGLTEFVREYLYKFAIARNVGIGPLVSKRQRRLLLEPFLEVAPRRPNRLLPPAKSIAMTPFASDTSKTPTDAGTKATFSAVRGVHALFMAILIQLLPSLARCRRPRNRPAGVPAEHRRNANAHTSASPLACGSGRVVAATPSPSRPRTTKLIARRLGSSYQSMLNPAASASRLRSRPSSR